MKVRTAITLALLVAAIAAPAALPAGSPDALDRAVSTHRTSNTLDPAIATAIADRRPSASPGFENPARTPQPRTAVERVVTGSAVRPSSASPGFENPARTPQTSTPVEQVVTGSAFGWGDFAIGAGSMLGLVLLLGGLRVAAHALRSKRGHPSTA